MQLVGLGWRMSLSLHSDSENSSSSDQHEPVFGSARVLPDSPTPYTDATQVCNSVPSLHAISHVLPFLSAQPDTPPSLSLSPSERQNNFYTKIVFLAPHDTVSSALTNDRP